MLNTVMDNICGLPLWLMWVWCEKSHRAIQHNGPFPQKSSIWRQRWLLVAVPPLRLVSYGGCWWRSHRRRGVPPSVHPAQQITSCWRNLGTTEGTEIPFTVYLDSCRVVWKISSGTNLRKESIGRWRFLAWRSWRCRWLFVWHWGFDPRMGVAFKSLSIHRKIIFGHWSSNRGGCTPSIPLSWWRRIWHWQVGKRWWHPAACLISSVEWVLYRFPGRCFWRSSHFDG